MHLIATLMAGVAGAESGTATLYQRGTTTVANYYTDFEGTAAYPGTSIALDARGGASVYVDSVVRVIVRDADGATIRDYVDGVAATAVEVASPAFVGNAYSGGASAAGNPTTLRAVLDKWLISAGATDFNVIMNGASASLQTALAAVAGLGLYVVTNPTYGALGDGVTDDRAAIQAAINAANAAGGGVVFFPGGTYRCASALTTYATVTFRGVDRARSTMSIDHDISEHFVGAAPFACEDLGFTLNIARTFPIIDIVDASACRWERCQFTAAVATGSFVWSTSGTGQESLAIVNCSVTVSGALTGDLFKTLNKTAVFSANQVRISGVYTGTVIQGSRLNVSNNFFHLAGTTVGSAGVLTHVSSGSITGNTVETSTTAAWTLIDGTTGGFFCDTVEAGNYMVMVDGLSSKYSARTAADYRRLGSRELTTKSNTTGSLDTLNFARHLLYVGINTTINLALAPSGSWATVEVENWSGAPITCTWGTGHAASGATFAVANGTTRTFLLQATQATGKWHCVADLAGAQETT